MTIHLFLDIIISIGIVLALTKKYPKPGLLLLSFSFLVKAIVTFWMDRDVVLGVFEAFASFSTLYEYRKAMRPEYQLAKRAKFMICTALVLLGVWSANLGTFSPFLIAGALGVLVILIEDSASPKTTSQNYK